MTTMLDSRDGMTAYVANLMTAHPDWFVEWDNQGVPDRDSLQKFLVVEVDFAGGRQADLGVRPTFRRFGMLKFFVAVREYSGKREQIGLMDFLADNCQSRYIGGATMKAAVMQACVTQQGWHIAEMWVPFEVDNR